MIQCPAGEVLEELDNPEPFREARNHLYRARFDRMGEVQSAYLWVLENCGLRNRARQLFVPLLTMAYLVGEETYVSALEFAKEYAEQRKGENINKYARVLISVLLDHAYLGCEVPLVNITKDFNAKAQDERLIELDHSYGEVRVSKMLQGLGLRKSSKRTDNRVHYLVNAEIVNQWAYRYELKDIPANASLSSFSSFNESEGLENGKNGISANEVNEASAGNPHFTEAIETASRQASDKTNEVNEVNEVTADYPKKVV